jgi:hypothetical protein
MVEGKDEGKEHKRAPLHPPVMRTNLPRQAQVISYTVTLKMEPHGGVILSEFLNMFLWFSKCLPNWSHILSTLYPSSIYFKSLRDNVLWDTSHYCLPRSVLMLPILQLQ